MKAFKNTICIILCAVFAMALASCKRSEEGNIPYTNLTITAQNVMMTDLDPIAAAKLLGDATEIGKIFDNESAFTAFAGQIDNTELCDTYNSDYFKNGDLIFAGVKTKSNVGFTLTAVNLTGDVLTVTLQHIAADTDIADDTYIGTFIETEKLYAQGIKKVLIEVV